VVQMKALLFPRLSAVGDGWMRRTVFYHSSVAKAAGEGL
jgi:hypothetical protein